MDNYTRSRFHRYLQKRKSHFFKATEIVSVNLLCWLMGKKKVPICQCHVMLCNIWLQGDFVHLPFFYTCFFYTLLALLNSYKMEQSSIFSENDF